MASSSSTGKSKPKVPKLFENISLFPPTSQVLTDFADQEIQEVLHTNLAAQSYNYTLEQWKLIQATCWPWDILICSGTTVNGFDEDGKFLFRKIAHKLRSFHLGGYFCGSLFKSIRISHDLDVTFSAHPILAKDDSALRDGIMVDTLHYRLLVAKIIAKELKIKNIMSKSWSLSMGILLFFSGIFIDRIQANELQVVKDYSFLQMFHPVFFNSVDRTHFMHLIHQYRVITTHSVFLNGLDLCNYNYGICGRWTLKLDKNTPVYNFLKRGERHRGVQYVNYIPIIIRNALVHFKEREEGMGYSQEVIEECINKEFPDLCPKLLDCLMRNLNDPPSFQGCRLADLFEMKPMGIYTRPYKKDPRQEQIAEMLDV